MRFISSIGTGYDLRLAVRTSPDREPRRIEPLQCIQIQHCLKDSGGKMAPLHAPNCHLLSETICNLFKENVKFPVQDRRTHDRFGCGRAACASPRGPLAAFSPKPYCPLQLIVEPPNTRAHPALSPKGPVQKELLPKEPLSKELSF